MEDYNFSELRDAEVCARMRQCNYEKFKTLVRMHLSFELDLNTDEFDLPSHEIVYDDKGKIKKWNRLSKKHKQTGCGAGVVGGYTGGGGGSGGGSGSNANNAHSPTETLNQQIDQGFLFHLQEIKEFLMLEKNIIQEGIFRKTGSILRQNELRKQIQNDKPLELELTGYSVHDCASVFKAYLAELPEPLLTDAHYPAHEQIAPLCMGINIKLDDNDQKSYSLRSDHYHQNSERLKKELHVLNSVQLLLLLLPEDNRQLLQHIIDMLHAVALKQSLNRMGPDNLATLFAPHLICPRNLPPEALHYLARKMSSVISYMIIRGQDIFSVPAKLATDIRAYFLERKRKKTMSPEMLLDDSISDISTVNTVYTFVDREKTAAAHHKNNTETELAQLYAHIQSMPESSKKRRLIKQFNKQNGQGTPLQLQAMNRVKQTETQRPGKSISDSIKKHIFHKGLMSSSSSKTPKRQTPLPAVIIETPNNSVFNKHKQRVLFQSPNPPPPPPPSSSSASSTTSYSSNCVAAATTSAAVKMHPLQKSISSSSLLLTSATHNIHYNNNNNINHKKNGMLSSFGNATALRHDAREESSSSSTSSSSSAASSSSSSSTSSSSSSSLSTCTSASLASNNYSSKDGFERNTAAKSISAPVSRQTSSDLQYQCNLSMSTTSSSHAHSNHAFLDVTSGDCVTPLKLITETAKKLRNEAATAGVDKKSVAWNDSPRIIERLSNPSTPTTSASTHDLYHTPTSELKSRYKSEPNLSLSFHQTCETPIQTQAHERTPLSTRFMPGKTSITRKLMKGVSMSSLKFPFNTPETTRRIVRTVSSTLKRRASDDAQIYHQAEGGSFAAAIKAGNAPLLQDIDDEEIEDEDTFEDDQADEHDYTDDGDDEENGQSDAESTRFSGCIGGGSSSSELPNFTHSALSAYQQQQLLQNSGIYRNIDLVTSTPSLLLGRRSMSPITKSAQRMPKAMQESIMTPRSRKPVMVLTTTASSNDANQTINQTDLSEFREQDEDDSILSADACGAAGDKTNRANIDDDEHNSTASSGNILEVTKPLPSDVIIEDATSLGGFSDIFKRRQMLQSNHSFTQQKRSNDLRLSYSDDSTTAALSATDQRTDQPGKEVLSSNFKEYLLKRSVLTDSPEDASFTSHSDDFNSSHEIEDIDENQLSSSLLYCLDGNRPEKETSTEQTVNGDDDQENSDNYDDSDQIQKSIESAVLNKISNKANAHNDEKQQMKRTLTANNTARYERSSSNNRSYLHAIDEVGCSFSTNAIVKNRLATNPFVILNNARKRAATNDFEKMSSTLFNSKNINNNDSIFQVIQQQISSKSSSSASASSSSSSNKENRQLHAAAAAAGNLNEDDGNYVLTKKLLMTQYPGETNF